MIGARLVRWLWWLLLSFVLAAGAGSEWAFRACSADAECEAVVTVWRALP